MTSLTVRDARTPQLPRREHHPGYRKTLVGKLVTHLCVLVGVALSVFPFYWLLVMSTNTTADIIADFAAGLGGLAVALDLRSGRRLWEREVTAVETPWSAGDALFLVSTGGELACLGREDGRVRWITSLGRFENERRRRDPIFW